MHKLAALTDGLLPTSASSPTSPRMELHLSALRLNLLIGDNGLAALLHRRIKMLGLYESRLNVLEFSCTKFQDVAKTKSKLT